MFQCLQVATTTLVATHLKTGDKDGARRTLGLALFLAAAGGLATTLVFEV